MNLDVLIECIGRNKIQTLLRHDSWLKKSPNLDGVNRFWTLAEGVEEVEVSDAKPVDYFNRIWGHWHKICMTLICNRFVNGSCKSWLAIAKLKPLSLFIYLLKHCQMLSQALKQRNEKWKWFSVAMACKPFYEMTIVWMDILRPLTQIL